MAAEGDNNFMRYIYRGEEGEIIPHGATHIFVGADVTFVRARAFSRHQNIVEVICHDNVKKIEREAFELCRRLRRVIMPGVKIVEAFAFSTCPILADVECGKLEIIERAAFGCCESLRSINLPFIRILEAGAFNSCITLREAKISNKLERIDREAFLNCFPLERIAIPLKDGLIVDDDIFMGCESLKHVDLIEGELDDTIVSLHLEDWKNDMIEEIDSINRILPDTYAGYFEFQDASNVNENPGEKAQVIRTWIRSVLRTIIHYQAEHQQVLNVATTTLKLALPHDIVTRSVLPFLELPSHTFELAEGGDEDEDEISSSEGSSSEGEESGMEEEDNSDDKASSKRRRIEML